MERRKFAQAPDPYWNVPKKQSKKAQLVAAAGLGTVILLMAGALPVIAGYCTSHIVKSPSRSAWGQAFQVKQMTAINHAVQATQTNRRVVASRQ